MLVAERLLSYEAHRGYFVTRIDDSEMSQVYLIRRVLEAEVLQSIRWPEEEELANFERLRDDILKLLTEADIHDALGTVREFSFTLFELSSLDLLVNEVKRFWDVAAVYRALSFRPDSEQAQHTAEYYAQLISCLKRHDREGLITLNSEQRTRVPGRVASG